ncbi:membrane protein insertase YidC, partial [Desulfovibrio sp. OttesenSCG-928-I05]|nr:membrane protein insertase YidC [Desulfovibrio sp. OttesenSCG-928-I05]
GTLRFDGEVGGIRVTRELAFDAATFAIRETTTAESATPQAVSLGYTMSSARLDDGDSQYNLTRLAWDQGGSYTEETSEKDMAKGFKPDGNISWAAVMSNYFTAAISPNDPDVTVNAVLEDRVFRVAVKKDGIMLTPGQTGTFSGIYYLGPKDQDQLSALPNDMSSLVHYGFFSIISRPLIAMLKFFNGYVHNWGIAIIILTVLIKILLWPLSHKSYKSMQQMKKLQPMMLKLKEKYKDDKEALNREMMQLYRTYKVNPMGGCLPILVQIPVFFGLYQGLMNAIELRHAAFVPTLPFTDWVWLADLSAKDPYYITPIIMGGTMFLQQWLTPTTGDPTQKKIMMFMPLIFTVLFLNFPSGLVVYWLTNNVISIGQQWWQLRKA